MGTRMKKSISMTLIVLVTATFLRTVPASSGSMDDWTSHFIVTIDNVNNTQELTDYQVLVKLDSNNFNFQRAHPEGNDLRFTTRNGDILPYWIESYDSTSEEARIWVKVDSIPASDRTTIIIHYGNPTAASASNGDATFEFFDDFSGDLSKWISNGVSITSGYAAISPSATIWTSYMYSTTNFDRTSIGYFLSMDIRVKGETNWIHEIFMGFGNAAPGKDQPRETWYYGVTFFDWMGYLDAAIGGVISDNKPGTTLFHTYIVCIYKESGGFISNSYSTDTATLTGADNNMRVKINPYKGGADVDNVYVRKYTRPEPTATIEKRIIKSEIGSSQRVPFDQMLRPLALFRISHAAPLKEEVHLLLQDALQKGLDISEVQLLIENADELLEDARNFYSSRNYIAANNLALQAIYLYEQAIEILKGLLK